MEAVADRDAIPGEKRTPSNRALPGCAVAAAQHCSALFTVAKLKHEGVGEGDACAHSPGGH